jgi:hypothetical protein
MSEVWLNDPRTKIMLAGWAAIQSVLQDHAVQGHVRGWNVKPITDAVKAQQLWEGVSLSEAAHLTAPKERKSSWTNPRHSYGRESPYSCVKCGDPFPGRARAKRSCPGYPGSNGEDSK